MLAMTLAEPIAEPLAGPFQSASERLAAVRRRDSAADDEFFYAVATTGVYCRPSCAARPARAENISFYRTRPEVERAGFRPCKRCRPELPPRAAREAALIAAACRSIESAETQPSLAALAAAAGLSPHHFHRLFRRIAGVTPKAYAGARRQARAQETLSEGAPVTQAIYAAGFNSAGRFYAAADGMLGMAPSRYSAGGTGEIIRHAVGQSSLGPVLVAATDIGVCAIFIGDDIEALRDDLAARFPRATLKAAEPDFAAMIARVVELLDHPETNATVALPLDIRGTVFQRRVWEALRAIPPGETRSYAEIAAAVGAPKAMRAVGGACGANKLAVVIPCHRVVGSNGTLTGYHWGADRKRKLLARESSVTEALVAGSGGRGGKPG